MVSNVKHMDMYTFFIPLQVAAFTLRAQQLPLMLKASRFMVPTLDEMSRSDADGCFAADLQISLQVFHIHRD